MSRFSAAQKPALVTGVSGAGLLSPKPPEFCSCCGQSLLKKELSIVELEILTRAHVLFLAAKNGDPVALKKLASAGLSLKR